MNERIKTLCKEAFTEAHESRISPDGLVRSDGNPYIFYEKFAKLIVRECADACYKHKDVESFGIYPVRVAMVTKACSDNIKEHFGVEE